MTAKNFNGIIDKQTQDIFRKFVIGIALMKLCEWKFHEQSWESFFYQCLFKWRVVL